MSILPHAPLPDRPGIYGIIHLASGRCYVGSATSLRARHSQHSKRLSSSTHANQHLQNAWNKYGPQAFLYRVLDYVDDVSDLLPAEQQWMGVFPLRYNVRPRAESNLGLKFSAESRERCSAARRGWKHSVETRARIAAGNVGRKMSADVRARLSDKRKGRTLPPEWRANIGKGLKGRPVTPENLAKRARTRSDPAWQASLSDSLRRTWAEKRTPAALAARAGLPEDAQPISIKQAAAIIGCTGTSVRRMIHDGTLPATPVGKFWVIRRMDVEERLQAIQRRLDKHPHKRKRPLPPVLTRAQERRIRDRYAMGGNSMASLGQDFGVCASRIWRIVHMATD